MAHYAAAASRAVSRLRHGLLILGGAGLSAFCAAVAAAPASAHGFGERYDLPLPLSLFVIAGAAAVALSFVIAAAFLPGGAGRGAYPRCNLLRIAPVRWLAAPWVTATLRTLSVALTVYVILGGLIGTERAALNPAPAAVYVAFWVGLSFFTALFGNLWALVNPWSAAWGFAENLADAVAPGRSLSRRLPWPARWGQWPAALVFAGFAILETVAAGAAGPRALGWILVGYTAYNFAGMFLFGAMSGCATPKGSRWCTDSWRGSQLPKCARRNRCALNVPATAFARPTQMTAWIVTSAMRRHRRRNGSSTCGPPAWG